MLVPRRVESEELLDQQNVPREDFERSLRDLRRINRYLGGIRIYKHIVRRFSPGSIVDLGAGTCDQLEALPNLPLRIGLDFKIEHLLYLRGQSSVHRVVGDAHHLPFRNDAVDLVTSAHFFHHFGPAENVAILRESMRVARRGVAVNDTRRHYVPLVFTHVVSILRLAGRVTRYDAPASVRQAYTVAEARAIASEVTAAKRDVVRFWPFRLGILLWR